MRTICRRALVFFLFFFLGLGVGWGSNWGGGGWGGDESQTKCRCEQIPAGLLKCQRPGVELRQDSRSTGLACKRRNVLATVQRLLSVGTPEFFFPFLIFLQTWLTTKHKYLVGKEEEEEEKRDEKKEPPAQHTHTHTHTHSLSLSLSLSLCLSLSLSLSLCLSLSLTHTHTVLKVTKHIQAWSWGVSVLSETPFSFRPTFL